MRHTCFSLLVASHLHVYKADSFHHRATHKAYAGMLYSSALARASSAYTYAAPQLYAVLLARMLCSTSAHDAYNFYTSTAIVVYVALLHYVEIYNVSTDGSLHPFWLIRSSTDIFPVPDE